MDKIDLLRKQIISRFAGMTFDMDYRLCVPSVHAKWRNEELIVDFGGNIRSITSGFPKDKADMVSRWAVMHRDEIMRNHLMVGQGAEPLKMIDPLPE